MRQNYLFGGPVNYIIMKRDACVRHKREIKREIIKCLRIYILLYLCRLLILRSIWLTLWIRITQYSQDEYFNLYSQKIKKVRERDASLVLVVETRGQISGCEGLTISLRMMTIFLWCSNKFKKIFNVSSVVKLKNKQQLIWTNVIYFYSKCYTML